MANVLEVNETCLVEIVIGIGGGTAARKTAQFKFPKGDTAKQVQFSMDGGQTWLVLEEVQAAVGAFVEKYALD